MGLRKETWARGAAADVHMGSHARTDAGADVGTSAGANADTEAVSHSITVTPPISGWGRKEVR